MSRVRLTEPVTARLDKIATELEQSGRPDLAMALDRISDRLDEHKRLAKSDILMDFSVQLRMDEGPNSDKPRVVMYTSDASEGDFPSPEYKKETPINKSLKSLDIEKKFKEVTKKVHDLVNSLS